MLFYSTADSQHRVGFREAILPGIAPNRGLYMPNEFPKLPKSFFDSLPNRSLPEIGVDVLSPFTDSALPKNTLRAIVERAFSFRAPLVQLSDGLLILELFHGPTLAFKDFGARFMAELFSHFAAESQKALTVLVATSGDTGGAVANAFLNKPAVRVVVLYPSGKVSPIQEKQLTTLGGNISALEVKGSFDDCQRMVKDAFQDGQINSALSLTSANSISLARLLPQSVYYFSAYGQLSKQSHPPIFSVPSGNFGNLTAGLFAWKMGLPVDQFIAATNSNDVVPKYLKSGSYTPKRSIETLSNAMDVGDPSNFARICALFNNNQSEIAKIVSGYSCSDLDTSSEIKEVFSKDGYIMDPHTAVGSYAIKSYLREKSLSALHRSSVVLSTAHPAKFGELIQQKAGINVPLLAEINKLGGQKKVATTVHPKFDELKQFLLSLSK